MGGIMPDLSFLSTQWGFYAFAICAILIAIGVFTGKIRLNQGKFELGDNTKFEKTNARFKAIVENSQKTYEAVGTLSKAVGSLKEIVSKLETNVDSVRDEQTRQSLDLLRLQIHDEQINCSERLRLFDLYEKRGGNGETALYVETILRPQVEKAIKERS
jgi:hypothetical protein